MTDDPRYDPFADDELPTGDEAAEGTEETEVTRATRDAVERHQLVQQMRGGGGWFFWIAGVSVVNAVVAMTGGAWSFLFSLTFTDLLSGGLSHLIQEGEISEGAAAGWRIAVGAISLFAIGVFVFLGVFSRRGAIWAFGVGLVLYGLDAALTLFLEAWVNLAFHVWALVGLWGGLQAARKLRAMHIAETDYADTTQFGSPDFEP